MDLLIAANSVAKSAADTAPSSGTPQYATDGNPVTGVPATSFPAYHYNMLMGELYNLIKAAGLTPSGSDWTQVEKAVQELINEGISSAEENIFSAGRLLKNTIYTTVGTSTFTPSTQTQWVIVEVLGGGGAGGGCQQTGSGQQAVSWGGTGGTYAKSGLYSVKSLSTPVTVTVGAGGAPVFGSAGGSGGASSFGSYLTSPGGAGGALGTANTVGMSLGGDSGPSNDATGPMLLISQRGSGGFGPIALGSQTTTRAGSGGRSFLGPGGQGPTGATSSVANGYLGGGGSGQALGPSSVSSASGGSGGPGCVIVWEYA